jgi:protein TonB
LQTHSALLRSLGSDINDRSFLGILTVLVVLLHLLIVMRLLEPRDDDTINTPVKVVEVVILPPEPVVPKEKAAPPAPAPTKPIVQKIVAPKQQPPKKIVKPVVNKEPVAQKKPVPTKPIIDDRLPILSAPTTSVQKPTLVAPSTAKASAKPVSKTGSGDSGDKGTNSGVALIARVNPVYPARATSRHIEGWVKIEFTVTPSGTVSNPAVVSASPPGIFDSAALDAIRKWKFKPRLVNGQAVTQRAVQTVKFTLSK